MYKRSLEEHICEKFLDLVEKKPFYRIKVKELVEYAGIGRSTFYIYFDSIYAVVQKIEDDFMAGFIPDDDAIAIMVNGNIDVAYRQNDYLKKHSRELILLTGANGDPMFEYKLEKRFRDLNKAIWGKNDTRYSTAMKDCLGAYLAAGNVAFIKWWTAHTGEYTEDEFLRMLDMLMIDASRLLLDKNGNDKGKRG